MRSKKSRGQAMAEFALVAPIFFLMLFAVIDFGRYVYTANGLNQSAREAARIGSVAIRPECTGTRDACIQQVAKSRTPGIIGTITLPAAANGDAVTAGDYGCFRLPAAGGTAVSVGIANCQAGDLLKVRVQNQFQLVTPIVSQFLGTVIIRGDSLVTVNQ